MRKRHIEIDAKHWLFKAALDNIDDAVSIIRADVDLPGPEIIYVNRKFTEIFGYRSEEILGQSPRILQGPKTDCTILDRLRATLLIGDPFVGEAINYAKDGTERHISWAV